MESRGDATRLGDDWEDDRGEWVTRMLSVLDAILAY